MCSAAQTMQNWCVLLALKKHKSVSNGQPGGFTDEQLRQGQRRKCLACVGQRPLVHGRWACFVFKEDKTCFINGQADGFTDLQFQQGQRRKCLVCVRLKRHSVICNLCGEYLLRRSYRIAGTMDAIFIDCFTKRHSVLCNVCGELLPRSRFTEW